MRTAVYFYVAVVLALLSPHVGGWLRLPWLVLFAVVLYGLLWRGLAREK